MCKRKSSGGMGFRSLRDFYVALLGKQGWRLLQYPEKLVIRVYKARYFSKGSFLNAKIGINSSYIWGCVLESQSLLKQGVGCRAYIHINSPALQGQMVSSLLNDDNQWDLDLIMDILDNRYASIILSIPVHSTVDDSWY